MVSISLNLFAESLGFRDFQELWDKTEVFECQNTRVHIVQLHNGKWFVWDSLAPGGRLRFFDTKEEALDYCSKLCNEGR